MKVLRPGIAVSVAGLLLVAACGSDDDGSTTTQVAASQAPPASGGPAASAPDATAAPGSAAPDADEWDAIVEEANAEGEVNLYLSMPLDEEMVASRFEETYPDIDLVITREGSSDLATRLREERDAGASGADVAMNAVLDFYYEDGSVQQLPVGPNRAAWEGSEFLLGDMFYPFFPAAVTGRNTEHVADPVTDITQLFGRPEYVGKIGLMDLVADVVYDYYKAQEEIYGPTFLEDLAAMEPRIYPGAAPIANAVASGEIWVGYVAAGGAYDTVIANGAPVSYEVPERGGFISPYAYLAAITGWSTHPNAAAVLMDWMMSEEGQETLIEAQGYSAASPVYEIEGAPSAVDSPDVVIVDRSEPLTDAERNEYRERWNSLFL